MRVFFDSSALAKRYIVERGTDSVLARLRKADEILLSAICLPEIVSAFCRLRREGKLSQELCRELKTHLALDFAQASVIEVSTDILAGTVACLEGAVIRTLDAIHVVSAGSSSCDLFVSADRQQCAVAKSMGIKTELV